jgi:hypothetical protein
MSLSLASYCISSKFRSFTEFAIKLSVNMDHTNIIDTDEAAYAMAAASQGKGKGKGRKKSNDTRASSPIKPMKTTMEPTKARSKTPASPTSPTTPTSTQASAPRFYEANGLKIPLYSQNGLGNKKRPNARLSKTLLKYNTDELLDIVGQYAGADKRQELKNKGLAKTMLANWIEEKETLALGRNPKSELSCRFIPTLLTASRCTYNPSCR